MLNIDANSTSGYVNLDTSSMFDSSFRESNTSPIDTFIGKMTNLTRLVDPSNFDELMANLVVLGSVSAVESYMREIIRKCILVDSDSKIKCEKQFVTYGAAISHNHDLMPEAILENYSFASKKNILDSLRELLGISGMPDNSVDEALNEFLKVCHIRHCLVHRYGKLGTKNAIELGLSKHSRCIEKPLKLNYSSLQESQAICLSMVKEVNNYIFKKLLLRLIIDEKKKKKTYVIWRWHYGRDKKKFNAYYDILVSQAARPDTHSDAKNAYNIYKSYYKNLR